MEQTKTGHVQITGGKQSQARAGQTDGRTCLPCALRVRGANI